MSGPLEAGYFDGRTTRVHKVILTLTGDRLAIEGDGIGLDIPWAALSIDERLGNSPRRLHLPGGAFCVVSDLDRLELMLGAAGHRDGHVDRLQRKLGIALIAGLVCILLAAAAYLWGLPWAAAIGARHIPPAVGRALTEQTLRVLEGSLLQPTELSEERQAALRDRLLALHLPEGGTPRSVLLFRRSPALKANAFTLPDGTIILLDDLVNVLGNDDQIMAVLSHELGHAHGRHGLQLLIQSSAAGAFWSLYIGDVSALFAAAPTILMQARFSRDLEAQADDYGAEVLAENGLSPSLLADALEKLEAQRGKSSDISYLANHPPTQARIEGLRHRTH